MTTKNLARAHKNVELVNNLASFFDSEMAPGEKIGMTRLAKSIILRNGSNPHVETVRAKCTEFSVVKDFVRSLRFIFDKNEGLVQVEKIEPQEIELQKAMHKQLKRIEEKLGSLEQLMRKQAGDK